MLEELLHWRPHDEQRVVRQRDLKDIGLLRDEAEVSNTSGRQPIAHQEGNP